MSDLLIQSGDELDKLVSDVAGLGGADGGCWILVQSFDAVRWGFCAPHETPHWRDQAPTIEGIMELRAFSADGEAVVWRDGGQLRVSWPISDDPDSKEVEPKKWPNQLLRGTRAEPDGITGWTRISDGRGASYAFPADIRQTDLPLALQVRHVLRPDEDTGVALVVRSRLAGVIKASGVPAR